MTISRLLRAANIAASRWRCAAVDQGEAVSAESLLARTEEARRQCSSHRRQAVVSPSIIRATPPARSFHHRSTMPCVLTMDGVGERAPTSMSLGSGKDLRIGARNSATFRIRWDCSIPRSPTTPACTVAPGEHTLMGLAPHTGSRSLRASDLRTVDRPQGGRRRLPPRPAALFDHCTGLRMTRNEQFDALSAVPAENRSDRHATQFHMDVAASIQAVTDEIMLCLARSLAEANLAAPTQCPGWRRRLEPCGQRQGSARRGVQERLDSACRRRRGRGALGAALCRLPSTRRPRSHQDDVPRWHARELSRPLSSRRTMSNGG